MASPPISQIATSVRSHALVFVAYPIDAQRELHPLQQGARQKVPTIQIARALHLLGLPFELSRINDHNCSAPSATRLVESNTRFVPRLRAARISTSLDTAFTRTNSDAAGEREAVCLRYSIGIYPCASW